jgi:sporulation protein YlmC with PRC-barrel domain
VEEREIRDATNGAMMEPYEPDITETNSPDAPAVASNAESEATVDHQDLSAWRGRDLIDRDGETIGTLEDVYFDIETEQPQFGTVKEGFLDRHLTFVPLTAVTVGPESIQVAVTKQLVKDAPKMENEGDALTQADESLLYHYYQLVYTPSGNPSGRRLARR